MAFRTQIKVCFADVDNAGIVYYPRFLHYFHLAMEEFFDSESIEGLPLTFDKLMILA